MTAEEIAEDIYKNDPLIRGWLLTKPKDFWESRQKLVEFPRWIRNKYKLWERLDLGKHPDDFSIDIINCLLRYKG